MSKDYEYDEYEICAAQALQERHAWKLQTMANIEAYKAQGDMAGMSEEIVRLGKINQEEQGLRALQQQHWQSKQPRPQGPAISPEMEAAKSVADMDWNDSYKMAMGTAKTQNEANAI